VVVKNVIFTHLASFLSFLAKKTSKNAYSDPPQKQGLLRACQWAKITISYFSPFFVCFFQSKNTKSVIFTPTKSYFMNEKSVFSHLKPLFKPFSTYFHTSVRIWCFFSVRKSWFLLPNQLKMKEKKEEKEQKNWNCDFYSRKWKK